MLHRLLETAPVILLFCTSLMVTPCFGSQEVHQNKFQRQEKETQEELTQEEAIQKLQAKGGQIRARGAEVFADLLKYQGTKKQFKVISAIKAPLNVKLNLRDQHELLEILGETKLKSLDFKCKQVLHIPDLELRAKITRALKRICQCNSIEKLDFSHADIDPDAMSSLSKLVNLKMVVLPASATDKTLSQLGALPKLKGIGFVSCRKITGSGFKDFKVNKQIIALSIEYANLNTENIKHLKKFPNLKTVVMPQSCDNEDVLAISKFANIERLHIGNSVVNDQAIDYLADMKNLKYLSIMESPISNRAAAKINKLKNLVQFICGETFMTRDGFDEIKLTNKRARKLFKPDSDEEMRQIQKLIDNNIPIKMRSGKMTELTLFLKKGRKYDLSKIEPMGFRWIYIFNVPSSNTLDAILKLNTEAFVIVNNPKIPASTIEKLKNRFNKVIEPNKRK